MARLFVSYSRKDESFVQRLVSHLDSLGADIWLDIEDIPVGMKWSTAIQHGLKTCELMLLIISPDSMASTNVEDEWQYYLDEKKPIVPILLHPAEIHFQLRRVQYVDFHHQDFDTAFHQLHEKLGRNAIMLQPPSKGKLPTLHPHTTTKSAVAPKVASKAKQTDFSLPLLEWINIPAGKVTLENNAGAFSVAPFAITKYLVTNAQFKAFIKDGAYLNDTLWEGLAQRMMAPQDPGWAEADHPRETVSWYEAIVFSRWLAAKTNLPITLPTEMQWQWAAVGDTGWVYPYGNALDKDLCNTKESGIGKTTPVNYYDSKLDGKTKFGVMDMSGNVWQWCLNAYQNVKHTDVSEDIPRALRGGAWNFSVGYARATFRDLDSPVFRRLNYGFRVVCSVPIE